MADDRTTKAGGGDVVGFLATVADTRRRADAEEVGALMAEVTGAAAEMWGSAIVGFGHRPYTTADGKERDWFAVGFSPRKANLVLYGLTSYGSNQDLLDRLGPHTTGKGCLYVKRLADVDRATLTELVRRAWEAEAEGVSRI